MVIETRAKLYSTKEAAKFMGLSPETVCKLVQRDLLSPSQLVGQAYLFEEPELKRYLRDRNPPGNPTFRRKKSA